MTFKGMLWSSIFLYFPRYKAEVNAKAGTILVIPKAEVNAAMLKALLVDEWPIWSAKTGGWPNLNTPYEYEYPKRVSNRLTRSSYNGEGTASLNIKALVTNNAWGR